MAQGGGDLFGLQAFDLEHVGQGVVGESAGELSDGWLRGVVMLCRVFTFALDTRGDRRYCPATRPKLAPFARVGDFRVLSFRPKKRAFRVPLALPVPGRSAGNFQCGDILAGDARGDEGSGETCGRYVSVRQTRLTAIPEQAAGLRLDLSEAVLRPASGCACPDELPWVRLRASRPIASRFTWRP